MLLKINPQEYEVFIGVDVDKKSYSVTHRSLMSLKARSFKMPADPPGLYRYFEKRFPGRRLVFTYEAGPTGYDLHDYLAHKQQGCIMVHPASVKSAPKDRVKTNKIDSRKLAEQLQGGQLEGIRVPEEPYRRLRHLVELRQQYARDRRRAKQRIQSLLLFEHITLPAWAGHTWTAQYRHALHEVSVNDTLRFKLDHLLEDLEYARTRLLEVHRRLRSFCRTEEAIRKNMTYLQSIPGFGFLTSSYLLARVGNPKYLRVVRELASFVGLVPSEKSTGENISRGSITHMGDGTLRSLLVEAAWVAIRKDTELNQFFHRLRRNHKAKKGAGSKAIVAVARKLTYRAHRVLKDQRPYVIH